MQTLLFSKRRSGNWPPSRMSHHKHLGSGWERPEQRSLTELHPSIYALHALGTLPVPSSLTALIPEGR